MESKTDERTGIFEEEKRPVLDQSVATSELICGYFSDTRRFMALHTQIDYYIARLLVDWHSRGSFYTYH